MSLHGSVAALATTALLQTDSQTDSADLTAHMCDSVQLLLEGDAEALHVRFGQYAGPTFVLLIMPRCCICVVGDAQ